MENQEPILQLIEIVSSELRQEIIYNDDSTEFWKKAQDYVFDNSIASVREGISTLSEAIGESPDMYSYLSSMIFRVFSQPFTKEALKRFAVGFDEVSDDAFFRNGFGFTAKDMTIVEQFILFVTVHRNQIQLAFLEAEQLAEDKRQAEIAAKRNQKVR